MSAYVKSEKAYKNHRKRYRSKKIVKPEYYCADFETTTDENTYVWSACICKLHTEDIELFSNIKYFLNYCFDLEKNSRIYFHNLKFDGTFIISYLLKNGWTSTITETSEGKKEAELKPFEFKYLITDKGQWYCIVCKTEKAVIEFYDSLKILPFNLKKLTNDFDVEHKKTEMQYDNKRSLKDCSYKDIEYIKNDVLGLKECLEIYEKEYNLESMTIGSACMKEFKHSYYKSEYGKKHKFDDTFLKLEEFPFTEKWEKLFNVEDCEQFIRKSYKGGFCYVNPKIQGMTLNHHGDVYDCNSLYPYVMYARDYPVGQPQLFKNLPEYFFKMELEQIREYYYLFYCVEFNDLKLKSGKLPCIQVKNDYRFSPNEWQNSIRLSEPKLFYLTQTDFDLICENYDIGYMRVRGGIYFKKTKNCPLFKNYIDKHMAVKKANKGAKRAIAKLYLNNLYGKFATGRGKNYKIIEFDKDTGKLKYKNVECEELKSSIDIAIGSAITAYAREYTIRTAQANIEYYCYSDTDSVHLICDKSQVKDMWCDDKELGAWKIESSFEIAKFLRQKTYCEIDKEHNINLTACGMNADCKSKVKAMIEKDGLKVFSHKLEIINGKLITKLEENGTFLKPSVFTIR